jgi:predicted nucleic acid-binding protein
MVHCDTNFLIQATVAGSPAHAKLTAWASAQELFNVCTIAWAEFLCGPMDPTAEALARQIFPNPEPFLPADAALAASVFNQTGLRSRSLADCMIAAVAIRCGAKPATLTPVISNRSSGMVWSWLDATAHANPPAKSCHPDAARCSSPLH